MQATQHLAFIVTAYAAAAVVVGALTLWVMLDYRGQLRKLADLEKRGVTRRSAPAQPTLKRAQEEA
jgi:heme exporter protein D